MTLHNGRLNYGRATACAGQRSNLRGDWSTALFIWNAPPNSDTTVGDVTFRVTTATGSHAGFRQNGVTLSPNPDLPLPGAGAPAAPGGSGSTSSGTTSGTTTPPSSANFYPPPHAASPYAAGVGGVSGYDVGINVKFVVHGWLMVRFRMARLKVVGR